MTNRSYNLIYNSRFYILVSAVLLSLVIISITRLRIQSDQLFLIRTQQLYGLICIFYWYTALVISPIGYVIGKSRMKRVEYARRAIGVSAAYFALLHAVVAVWGQLGGVSGITTLSPLFKWSLFAGVIGVIVLLLLALTSFDKVITVMTFKRWKWLHRTVYAGGVLAVLHIWSIGTHVGYGGVQILAFICLAVLAGLEMNRITLLLGRSYESLRSGDVRFGLFITLWMVLVILILMIPRVANYRDDSGHANHETHHVESRHNEYN